MTEAIPAIFGFFIAIVFVAGLLTGNLDIWAIGFIIAFVSGISILIAGAVADALDL